jgi:hypothetical protein
MQRRARIAILALATAFFANGAFAQASKLPLVEVYKSPYCGCCGGWVAHLQKAGFTVKVNEVTDLPPLRERLGIPAEHRACFLP